MKWAGLLLIALPLSSLADKPLVSRPALMAAEKNFESHIGKLWPDDPVAFWVYPQGMYVNGFGAVFSAQVNLAQGTAITPFHQSVTKDEIVRLHNKKLERMTQFRQAMEDIMLSSAASLDTVPADEQIALGVSFFYWNWEDTTGLPQQLVLRAPKRSLVMAKSGLMDHAKLAASMTVQEF
jgi:hypothetical protein